jgi:hypothetical protein
MISKRWTGRGRPRGGHHSSKDTKILEYLVELATKRRIDATELFNAIVYAWRTGKATCRGLTVQCRLKKRGRAVFLIAKGNAVISQFPISDCILKETDPLKGFDYVRERVRYASRMRERKAVDVSHIKIKDLRAGMKRINLKARVIEISKPRLVLTRFNDYVVFANAILSDKTSTIKLTLWDGRIGMVSVNDMVQIENANVIMFRGEKQLRIGRTGSLKVIENNQPKPEQTVKCLVK